MSGGLKPLWQRLNELSYHFAYDSDKARLCSEAAAALKPARRVYIICAVRQASPARVAEIREYAEVLRSRGAAVHFPPDNAPQDDPTGAEICRTHLAAMREADEVHVFWDVASSGSHFDLGMAYALGKRIVPVTCEQPDPPGVKSYWKVMEFLAKGLVS